MTRKNLTVIFLLTVFISIICSFNLVGQTDIDIRSIITGSDLVYDSPASSSEEGMPIGNGRMGTLVWTTPTSLNFQINRVDIFGNNSASNSFFERNTDYCSGAGFVDIDFVNWGDEVFTSPYFKQHLTCYEGIVTTAGRGVTTETLAWNDHDVIAVRIDDQRNTPQAICINLRMLRDSVVRRGNHTAVSGFKIAGNQIILSQEFTEDNYYCGSSVAIGISGREIRLRRSNKSELQMIVKPATGSFTVFISSSSSFDGNIDIINSAVTAVESAIKEGFEKIRDSNLNWWKSFWDRSYVHLHSLDGEADFIQNNYNYFMYVMACSSRGDFPPKFNGMIWITEGDARKWGNLYWGANQSCLYNCLFPANRMELMEPMFRMYSGMQGSLELAARQQWGSKGIYIPETVAFDGLPELPEDIAAEMRDLYLCKKPWSEKSGDFVDYASTKSPFQSRWNWKQDSGWKDGKWVFTDKGTQSFGHVTHIFSRGAKIAYQYWQRFEFTADTNWLRTTGYPMIKGIAEFYRNFPDLIKQSDGKYHIYNVNDNESVRGGHNTIEEISSMKGILPVVIKASEILNTDVEMRPVWKEFLENLSPLPLNSDYEGTFKKGTTVTFVRSLPPVVQGPGAGRPDSNTMPPWFFDLCNPLSKNTDMVSISQHTFDSYFPEGINSKTPVFVLSKLAVTGAMLGRKDATRFLIPNQIRTAEIETMRNRMTLREGYQTTGIQNLGRAADALHYALVWSSPPGPAEVPVIKLFPAWPDDWNADFRLLCRGNFLVTASFMNGAVTSAEILSGSGALCNLLNPWPGKTVILYRNFQKSEELKGKLLTFETGKNENIRLIIKK